MSQTIPILYAFGGAIICFGLGLFFARVFSRPKKQSKEDSAEADTLDQVKEAESDPIRGLDDTVTHEIDMLKQKCDDLTAVLNTQRSQYRSVCRERDRMQEIARMFQSGIIDHMAKAKQYVAAVNSRFSDYERHLEKSRNTARALSATAKKLKHDLLQTRREKDNLAISNEDFQRKISSFDRLADEIEASAAEMAAQKTRSEEAERLREEKASLVDALKDSKLSMARMEEKIASLAEVQAKNQDLVINVEKLSSQVTTMDSLKEENRLLKSDSQELSQLKEENLRLKSENQQLKAMGIIQEPSPEPIAVNASEGLGGSFQSIVNQLSQSESSRGVALADDLGLLIAGTGDHVEGMAGMAAVFSTICAKLDSLLPFGDIRHLNISNQSGLNLSMYPVAIEEDTLVMTTLSVDEGPDRKTIEDALKQIPSGA